MPPLPQSGWANLPWRTQNAMAQTQQWCTSHSPAGWSLQYRDSKGPGSFPLVAQLPQGSLPLPWCCRLGPHARCPTGQKRGERKAAFSRALMPTQCTWVGRGYTDTRGRKGGQEMRSDHVPREERGDLDGPVQSLPRALRGLFGRSNELLHTKPLTLGAVITVCPH